MHDKPLPPSERHIIVVALEQTLADHAGNPLETTIQLLSDLCAVDEARRELVVVSDKVAHLHGDIIRWLNANVDYYHRIVMRPAGTYTMGAAAVMHQRIQQAGSPASNMPLPRQILCALDSRPEMRAVWAEYGVPCYLTPNGGK
jgi:hypothetical protein